MKLGSELPDLRRLYLTDSEFHAFVDQTRQYIRQMRLSPSEVRAATMFAVYLEESEKPPLIGPIAQEIIEAQKPVQVGDADRRKSIFEDTDEGSYDSDSADWWK